MFEHQGNKLKSMVKDGITSVAKLSKALNVNRSNIYYLYGLARFDDDLVKKLKQIGLDVEAKSKQSNGGETVVELQQEIIALYKELADCKDEIMTLRQQLLIKTKGAVAKTIDPHRRKN